MAARTRPNVTLHVHTLPVLLATMYLYWTSYILRGLRFPQRYGWILLPSGLWRLA